MPGPEHLDWDAEALWQRLLPSLPDLSVEVLASCTSTNTLLLDRIRGINPARRQDWRPPGQSPSGPGRRHSDAQPCLLVAEHQTQGRGRQGKHWQSAAGASLTFSLALALAPANVSWSGLSLAVGLALANALDPPVPGRPPRLGLKWPNDLLLLDAPGAAGPVVAAGQPSLACLTVPIGRKLGGILIESVMAGSCRMAVVGVGLNVMPQATDALSWGYGCLQELDPALTAPAVLARVAPALVQALQRFEQDGFAPSRPGFEARDLLRGRAVTTTLPGLPAGIAEGVDDDGTLWLRVDGQRVAVGSGEVSLRLADAEVSLRLADAEASLRLASAPAAPPEGGAPGC